MTAEKYANHMIHSPSTSDFRGVSEDTISQGAEQWQVRSGGQEKHHGYSVNACIDVENPWFP